ncbi:uncharacterized protein LOC105393776 isoform X2 [Plutella xylostella]|uniref:uncharacterized protein LOC105393776 isoform X2 n=1 Tax=Plutella xylostella TaxID=51655 RepID=UPI0020324BD9|nr:uncharacterized protein LOC105393776 isoform X2 [Plutella xylostella]
MINIWSSRYAIDFNLAAEVNAINVKMNFLFVGVLVALLNVSLTQAGLGGLLGGGGGSQQHQHTDKKSLRQSDDTVTHEDASAVGYGDGSFKETSHSDFTNVKKKNQTHETSDVKVGLTLDKGLTVSRVHKRQSEDDTTKVSHSEDATNTQDGSSEASNSTYAATHRRESEEETDTFSLGLHGLKSSKTTREDTVQDSESRNVTSSHDRTANSESSQRKEEHGTSHDETHKTTTEEKSILDLNKGPGGVLGGLGSNGSQNGSPAGTQKKVTKKTTESKKSSKTRDVQEESMQTEVVNGPAGPAAGEQ